MGEADKAWDGLERLIAKKKEKEIACFSITFHNSQVKLWKEVSESTSNSYSKLFSTLTIAYYANDYTRGMVSITPPDHYYVLPVAHSQNVKAKKKHKQQ